MKAVRALLAGVIGLFVTDWTQTAGILIILAAGYALAHTVHLAVIGYCVGVLLAAHLLFTTLTEA